ncbi:MAG: hypothetical protein ABUL73_02910 [Alphaproteobacteria bacterium]
MSSPNASSPPAPTRFVSEFGRYALGIFLGALILMAPALLNGTPFFFADTAFYLAMSRLLHSADPNASIVALLSDPALPAQVSPADARHELLARAAGHLGARSVFYSLFLGGVADALGVWAVAFLQCSFVSASIFGFLNVVWRNISTIKYAALIAALTITTPLGIVATTLMPDIFSASMLLFCIIAFVRWSDLSWPVRILLGLGLLWTLLMHASNAPVAALTAAASAALVWFARRRVLTPVGFIAVTIVAAMALHQMALNAASAHIGVALVQPPFLTARVLDDGTGRELLRRDCVNDRYVLCRFSARLDAHAWDGGQKFLWDTRQNIGGYLIVDSQMQARLRNEEKDFVLSAVTTYPSQQLIASARNAAKLLVRFRPDGLSASYGFYQTRWAWLGNNERMALMPQFCRDDPNQKCGRFPFASFSLVYYFAVALSLAIFTRIFLTYGAAKGWRLRELDVLRAAVLIFAFGYVANAIVCGVLSGPFDRYSARIVWIFPLFAIAFLLLPSSGDQAMLAKRGYRFFSK